MNNTVRNVCRFTLLASVLICAGLAHAAPARDGLLDPAFGSGGIVDARFLSQAIDEWSSTRDLWELPDGKLLLAGSARPLMSTRDFPAVMRLHASGQLDTSFGSLGVAVLDDTDAALPFGGEINAITVLGNGRIVLAGVVDHNDAGNSESCQLIFALEADGTLISDYGSGPGPSCQYFGVPYFSSLRFGSYGAISDDGLGRVLIPNVRMLDSGDLEPNIARLGLHGELDTTFGAQGIASIMDSHIIGLDRSSVMLVQGDGSALIAAARTVEPRAMGVLRVSSAGVIDGSFGAGGFASTDLGTGGQTGSVIAISRDGLGHIYLLASRYASLASVCDYCVARFLPDGSSDASFNAQGIQLGAPGTMLLQGSSGNTSYLSIGVVAADDGSFKLVGNAAAPGHASDDVDFTVFSIRADGSFDSRFGDIETPGRLSLNFDSVAPRDDRMTAGKAISGGRLVLAGRAQGQDGVIQAIVRLVDDQVLVGTFED